jgi:DNA-binding MarR family transcriptional regulator
MLIQQTDTAIDAFHAHRGKSAAQRERVIAFIDRQGGDWSIGEIASMMYLEKSTVSARLNELLATGELEVRPKRKDLISGVTVRPVGLPVSQRSLF